MKTPQPATFRISYPKLISVGLSASMKAEGHLSIPQGLIVSTAQQSALISHHCKHQMCAQQEARQMRKYKNSILASDADYSGRCLPQERPRLLGHPWGPTRGGTVWDLCSWAHTSAVDSSHPSTQHFAELLLEASWSYSWAPNSAWKHLFFSVWTNPSSRLTCSTGFSSRAFPNLLWHLSEVSHRLSHGSAACVCSQYSGWALCVFLQ